MVSAVLKDRNGDKFTCAVDSSLKESICLTNTTTSAQWVCRVDAANLKRYYTGSFELASHHRIVVAILQDVYQGNIKRMIEWEKQGGAITLTQNHGIYCMELKLECWINRNKSSWVFPMTPEDPAAILKRQKELDAAKA